MDIIKILGVMASYIRDFFEYFDCLEVLCLVGIFNVAMFLLMSAHIIFGTKASTTRRARAIARYFNNNYIGSSLDAKKFLRKKRRLLNKASYEEFSSFINSTSNIEDTEFASLVMSRGKRSLGLVMTAHGIVTLLSGAFLFLDGWLYGLIGLELTIYVLVPILAICVIRGILYLMISVVNSNYRKASRLLNRSLPSIRYNNEYMKGSSREDIDESVSYLKDDNAKANEVVSKMMSIENTLDGDTQAMLRDGMEQVKDSLSEVDKLKYEEFLARYSEGAK